MSETTAMIPEKGPITDELLTRMNKYWRAANYLSACQLYLLKNPLLREPLTRDMVKKKIVGHWGTVPGQNFVFVHCNRVIKRYDLDMILLSGPGHGGNFFIANDYLDGSYTDVYPNITQDETGLQKLFKQFSFPGGVPSHCAPETPGSIHEGGELGYTLSHAYGAVLNNPSLLAFAVVGDGEAETGPLATSWQTNKLVNPLTDGIVLPILHLNGYKIANPTILARISDEERNEFFRGMGYHPYTFEAGFDDESHISIHRRFAALLEQVFNEICDIKWRALAGETARPAYPMIVFRTPKGWTCPKYIDGKKTEGSWRAHQVPLTSAKDTHEHFRVLRGWLRSYKPAELWNEDGSLKPEVTEFMPQGDLRLGANPNANGGLIREDLELPDIHDYEIPVAEKGHGYGTTEASRVFGNYTADVLKLNLTKFRVFGPDETASNRLQAAYKLTDKQWDAGFNADPENDSYLSTTGGVIEQLSEHQCEGLLEGFLLTGRHGVWSSYESFIHVVDSMINQHAKWLEATVRHIPWRKPIASLNILLSSHVWRQDHNGFSHQDPGFVDLLLNKNFHNDHVVQIYYPADANMLLCVGEEAYKSTNKINAIFAGKQPAPTFQSIDEAQLELQKGAATWDWAGNVKDGERPDIVLACCGDVPTLEMLAASDALQDLGIKVRFVNVVKLLAIQDHEENDASLTDEEFTKLFGEDVPVLFAFHAYAHTIYGLIHGRPNHDNFHVHGYMEEGSTTTPFDMLRLNEMDRFALAAHALEILDADKYAEKIKEYRDFREEAFQFAVDNGYDHPRFTEWSWRDVVGQDNSAAAMSSTGGDNDE